MPLVLPDTPAYAGRIQTRAQFTAVDPAVSHLFAAWLGDSAIVEKLVGHPGVGGHYRVTRGNGRLFVRVLPAAAADQANAVTKYVATWPSTAPLVHSLDLAAVPFGAEYVAFRYPWIEGAHPQTRREQLSAIGRSLAQLHISMAESTDAAQVCLRAGERTVALAQRFAAKLPERARSILAGCPAQLFALDDLPAGPLHGDLNPGNVLVNADNGAVLFCDFEDAIHSYGPPLLDLAFLVERLCLDKQGGTDAAIALLAAYSQTRMTVEIVRPHALFDAIALLNLRAVILLVLLQEAGREPVESEWAKFSNNVKQLQRTAPQIAAIEQAVFRNRA